MKKIPLTQGKFALVDDDDFNYLNQFRWYFEHGYARREQWNNNKRKRIYMHVEIAGHLRPDHRDGNGLNNQRSNLRKCTISQNQMNKTKRKKTSSKYKGVRFFKRDCNWSAQIMLKGKSYHLGYFDSENDAALAYNNAAIKMFGEFSKLNEIKEAA